MGENTRIYTHVSGKALKGMQQLFRDRDIYISANVSADGYTVLTAPKGEELTRTKWRKRFGKVAA
jgi:hypothetical protein